MKDQGIYLRPGVEEGSAMEAFFEFEETRCVLLCHEDGSATLHTVNKDGKPGKTEHGKGGWSDQPSSGTSDNPPVLRGWFATRKGSQFAFAGWLPDAERNPQGDEYISLRITPRVVRKGFFIGRKAA
jgi:hypothetical protein